MPENGRGVVKRKQMESLEIEFFFMENYQEAKFLKKCM